MKIMKHIDGIMPHTRHLGHLIWYTVVFVLVDVPYIALQQYVVVKLSSAMPFNVFRCLFFTKYYCWNNVWLLYWKEPIITRQKSITRTRKNKLKKIPYTIFSFQVINKLLKVLDCTWDNRHIFCTYCILIWFRLISFFSSLVLLLPLNVKCVQIQINIFNEKYSMNISYQLLLELSKSS